MPTWNADQYLKFANERTQPSRDLVARIALDAPGTIIDLGCGPGNSTQIVTQRWPEAAVSGLDSSPAMIQAARRDYPGQDWAVGDITEWASAAGPAFDLVFTNAALQWVGDHDALYPALLGRVAPGGALAVQVPANREAPSQRAIREVAHADRWRPHFPADGVREWRVQSAGFYYDCLVGRAAHLDIWYTDYVQVMDSTAAIVEWYKGTGLRPFLDALASDELRERFLADYLAALGPHYPPQADGKVLFPFRRLFLVAYR
jgi:trans-aconitate 2-methyltransferase